MMNRLPDFTENDYELVAMGEKFYCCLLNYGGFVLHSSVVLIDMKGRGCMLIGICDDSLLIREYVFEICKKVTEDRSEKIEIKLYADSRELAADEPDILILDIEMPFKDGIKIKQELQNAKKNTIIIFVTMHDEMMPSAFGVNVLGFIHKEEIADKLPPMLENAIRLSENFIEIEGIDSRDIFYIKAAHIYCEVHLSDGKTVLIRKSCKELEKELGQFGFIKISRFYLVNMQYIDAITDNEAVFTDNVRLPISVRNRAEVRKKYLKYSAER